MIKSKRQFERKINMRETMIRFSRLFSSLLQENDRYSFRIKIKTSTKEMYNYLRATIVCARNVYTKVNGKTVVTEREMTWDIILDTNAFDMIFLTIRMEYTYNHDHYKSISYGEHLKLEQEKTEHDELWKGIEEHLKLEREKTRKLGDKKHE